MIFSFSSVIGCRGVVTLRFAIDDPHCIIDLVDAATKTAQKGYLLKNKIRIALRE